MKSLQLLVLKSFLYSFFIWITLIQSYALKNLEDTGCPSENYTLKEDQQCYKLYNETSSREDAAKLCGKDNAYLPSIDNDGAQQVIINLLNNTKDNFWLGLKCTNDTYCLWDDGHNLGEYRNFLDDTVNADVGGCYYVKADPSSTKNGEWIPISCENQLRNYVICQQASTTDEICRCPENYLRNAANNDCYRYVSTLMTFNRANENCENDGSTLVTINSNEENTYVLNLVLNKEETNNIWIGLTYVNNTLQWVDGSPVNEWTNFKDGYPNNDSGNSTIMLVGEGDDNSKWINVNSSVEYASICRFKKK
uniref:C-type lectin domain-containing protein n=1 Tax=Strongyloides papillosus TaxID=174720 RepID=A0A0N5BNL9_STREA